jgi:hypothetical protein
MDQMNPLNNHPRIREGLLLVQWVITGLQTVLVVLFGFLYGASAADLAQWPTWFLASLVVAPALWSYLGFTAQGNVTGIDPNGYKLPVADSVPVQTNPTQEGPQQ